MTKAMAVFFLIGVVTRSILVHDHSRWQILVLAAIAFARAWVARVDHPWREGTAPALAAAAGVIIVKISLEGLHPHHIYLVSDAWFDWLEKISGLRAKRH